MVFSAKAQSLVEIQIKSAFIAHFSEHVIWKDHKKTPLKIAFLGSSGVMNDELHKMVALQVDKGNLLEIEQIRSPKEIQGHHMVIVGPSKAELVPGVLKVIGTQDILMVTDGYERLEQIMINFYIEDGSVEFQVNKGNVYLQGLDVSPELILYGGSEVDIARVYKDAKAKLTVALDSLELERERIDKNRREIKALTKVYEGQKDSLRLQDEKLESLNLLLTYSSDRLEEQSRMLEKFSEEINQKRNELVSADYLLDSSSAALISQRKEVGRLRDLELTYASKINNQIEELEESSVTIKEQSSKIEEDQIQISEQRQLLILQIGIIILIAVAGVFAYVAFRQKKKSELRLKERNDEILAQKELVSKRSIELEIALKELSEAQTQLVKSEKMATLGQLTAGVAHEINTPLGAILSSSDNINSQLTYLITIVPGVLGRLNEKEKIFFSKLIQPNVEMHERSTREQRKSKRKAAAFLESNGISDETMADYLASILSDDRFEEALPHLKSAQFSGMMSSANAIQGIQKNGLNIRRAVNLATKVLFALKKYTRKGSTVEMERLDLVDNIETVLAIYKNSLRDVELVKTYSNESLEIFGFGDELSQVWTNLIQNAVQAMGLKGRLEIKITNRDQDVLVSLSDTGPGIAIEIRDHVFDPFVTTKKSGEGTGLGLDIVSTIINKHGGGIHFDTETGVGTTFYVRLPKEQNQLVDGE